jgi:hypothetical protein
VDGRLILDRPVQHGLHRLDRRPQAFEAGQQGGRHAPAHSDLVLVH